MKSVEQEIEEQAGWLHHNMEKPTKARLGKDAYASMVTCAIPKFRTLKKKPAKKILTEDVQIAFVHTSAGKLKIIRDLSLPANAVVVE